AKRPPSRALRGGERARGSTSRASGRVTSSSSSTARALRRGRRVPPLAERRAPVPGCLCRPSDAAGEEAVMASTDWIIDADTHVTEPPDTWSSRLPAKYAERAPRIVRDPKWGVEVWQIGDGASPVPVG